MTLQVPSFQSARVLVAGDVMLDRYWFGPTDRVSPEAPVPVVQIKEIDERAGGAANVAVNLASLGTKTRLLGVVGNDDAGKTLESLLTLLNIECRFSRPPDVPTITKLRVLSRNQQLLRMDFEEHPESAGAEVANELGACLENTDLVILSDYAKGALSQVQNLISACRTASVPVLVDPKGSDFDRYRGATSLTPNLSEFEAVVGPCADEETLVERAHRLRESLDVDCLLITRSDKGMTLAGPGDSVLHLPAEAREVFDVTGAGDTVIAVFGAALAAGLTPDAAAGLSNLAAGLVVRKLGVAAVTASELSLALHQRGKGGRGLVDRGQAVEFVREAQARGEKVMMTNGCFDILHAGHVAYLEEAKALGDRLLVAVNDDASVKSLKGDSRPVNLLEDRMAVLSGLAAVDWVVPFSEESPEALICDVLPDVLVKGGDYQPEQIAGADCILANGGEVRVLSYREGRSTSSIIDSIKRG